MTSTTLPAYRASKVIRVITKPFRRNTAFGSPLVAHRMIIPWQTLSLHPLWVTLSTPGKHRKVLARTTEEIPPNIIPKGNLQIVTNLMGHINCSILLPQRRSPRKNGSCPIYLPIWISNSKTKSCQQSITSFPSVLLILLPNTNFLFPLKQTNVKYVVCQTVSELNESICSSAWPLRDEYLLASYIIIKSSILSSYWRTFCRRDML